MNLYKNKCLRESLILDFGGKGYKIFGLNEHFYIGKMIIITIFHQKFFIITQSYCYNTEYYCFAVITTEAATENVLEKKVFLKALPETLIQKRLQDRCFLVKLAKVLRISIFKNICERLFLQDITGRASHLFLFIYFFQKIRTS